MTFQLNPLGGDITRAAVLVGLQAGPAHGYLVGQRLQDLGIVEAFSMPRPSIHAMLPRLKREGLVAELREEAGERGRPRLVYQLTDAGQQELAKLLPHLAGQVDVPSARIELALLASQLLTRQQLVAALELRVRRLEAAEVVLVLEPAGSEGSQGAVADIRKRRLAWLQQERAWTQTVLERARAGAYPAKAERSRPTGGRR